MAASVSTSEEVAMDEESAAVEDAAPQAAPLAVPEDPARSTEIRPPGKPMLDIEAHLDLEVEDVPAAASKLRDAMRSRGADTVQDSMTREGGSQRATFTFRVPSASAGPALALIEGLGVVHRKDVVARDVSKEYFDAELRLDNLQRTLARYAELLQRTSDVDELLRIEQELSRLRGEIEQIKGTLRYLRDRVALATVVVTLWAPGAIPEDVIHPEATLYPGVRLGWVGDGGPNQPAAGLGSLGVSLRFAQRASIDLEVLRPLDGASRDVGAVWATIGMDTYSEFLGNGQRRTLNPYLGFRVGYGDHLPGGELIAGVTAGLELLKTEVVAVEFDLRALGLFGKETGTRLAVQPTLGANVAF
jgi:hypothetical protein